MNGWPLSFGLPQLRKDLDQPAIHNLPFFFFLLVLAQDGFMSKLPGFMFYPGDWLRDPNLRICSQAAKGLWIDLMCVAFECEERGKFVTNDMPWTREQVAGSVPGNADTNLILLDELLTKRVARNDKRGAIYSARMVRDEEVRNERSKAGAMGGRPTKYKYLNAVSSKSKTKAKTKQITEYENESENVIEKENKKQKTKFRKSMPENQNGNGHDFSPEFLNFWNEYPYKVNKLKAWESWEKQILETTPMELLDQILKALEWQIKSKIFTKNDGEFIPMPSTYLNKKRWTDEPKEQKEKFDMFNYKGE